MTWSNTGVNKVDLGIDSPRDRSSIFCTSGWLGCTRPGLLTESSVAPGATGTFGWPISVPNRNGSFSEYVTPVAEGITWMNSTGLNYSANIKASYSWQLLSQYSSTDLTNLTPGQQATVGITARNTGTATWFPTGNFPVRLGASHPNDRQSAFANSSWLNAARPTGVKEASVAPGQVGTFEFTYTAPATRGTYYEYFNIVVEGIVWTKDIGLNFYSVVR